MNKRELKELWGKYTDTNKLVDDISELATFYGHRNTEHGICTALNTFFENKQTLIEAFKKSKYYAGNLRIILPKEMDRNISPDTIQNAVKSFCDNVDAQSAIYKYTDGDGKSMIDHMLFGESEITIDYLNDKNNIKKLNDKRSNVHNYGSCGETIDSRNTYTRYNAAVHVLRNHYASSISQSVTDELRSYGVTVTKGLKTSRAFNKVCETYGVHKCAGYNKYFAAYSDSVSPKVQGIDFVMSLNPYDYLTMSRGESWTSCHNIGRWGRRSEYPNGGMRCGGTLSYMLDKSSIITFVVNRGSDPQESGKIYRNMFHYGNKTLVQGRVYPQSSDGATNLYDTFREFVIKELNNIFEFGDVEWKNSEGTSACKAVISGDGIHYPDYLYNRSCNVSYLTTKHYVYVGHKGICLHCGETATINNRLSHNDC